MVPVTSFLSIWHSLEQCTPVDSYLNGVALIALAWYQLESILCSLKNHIKARYLVDPACIGYCGNKQDSSLHLAFTLSGMMCGGRNLSPATVDGYFEGWVEARKNGTDNQHGHIVLEHELNTATVSMATEWLPQIQQAFCVVPFNQCMNISQPDWETNFVYPTDANPTPIAANASSSISTSVAAKATSTAAPASASAAGAASTSSVKSGAISSFALSSSITAGIVMMAAAYLM